MYADSPYLLPKKYNEKLKKTFDTDYADYTDEHRLARLAHYENINGK